MPLTSEWKPSDPIQLLIYGDIKTGKTAGALTAPRPVFFDFDNGIATAQSEWFKTRFGANRWIFYETFDQKMSSMGVPANYEAFDDACRYFDEWMKPAGGVWRGFKTSPNMFDTFVIDSGTSLSELCQAKALILNGKNKQSKSYDEGIQTGLITPRIQDYGSERSLLEQFVRMIQNSGKNVIMLCHEKQETNESGAVIKILPLLTGKSAITVSAGFDEVYNLQVRRKGMGLQRLLMTETDTIRVAGSRFGMPNMEVEWNWDEVMKVLQKLKKNQVTQPQLQIEKR